MSAVESELLKATKQKPKKKSESTQDYLTRVYDAADDLDDSIWEDLSETAQKWANAAGKAKNKDKELPPFPEDDDEEAEEDEDEDEGGEEAEEDEDGEEDEDEDEDEEEKNPEKKAKGKASVKEKEKAPAKGKEDKKKSDKKAEAKSEKPAGGRRGSGVTSMIKVIMLKNPTIDVEDLTAEIVKKGIEKPSNMTITTVRADMRHTLKIMHEAGVLSEAFTKKMDKAAA